MNPASRRPHRPFPTLLIFAAFASLSACEPAADEEPPAEDGAEQEVLNLPSVPLPEPPLNRTELLNAVARAASAVAAGQPVDPVIPRLEGRMFELRIRFGCRGPAPDLKEATFGWTFDPEDRTLRVRARPTVSGDDQLVQEVAGDEFEAVEGFWIPRPWLLQPVCPAAAAVRGDPAAPAEREEEPQPQRGAAEEEEADPAADPQETAPQPPAYPRVGIAQFFTDADPRTRQREMRPYETVKTIEANRPISTQGFNLVLSGRLRALPNRGVIHCVSQGADAPPDCLVSARIDQVRIEQPETREILAEWGGG